MRMTHIEAQQKAFLCNMGPNEGALLFYNYHTLIVDEVLCDEFTGMYREMRRHNAHHDTSKAPLTPMCFGVLRCPVSDSVAINCE